MCRGGTIIRMRTVLIAVVLGFVFFACGCAFMGLGVITDISKPDGPNPEDATPTSWYIRNVFQGIWNYQYLLSGTSVQVYRVTHEVQKNGELKFTFALPITGVKHFLATGTIDMNTGLFFGGSAWAQIGNEEGAITFTGTFATQTSQIEAYSVILDRRFNPGELIFYTISANRVQ